MLPHVLLLIGIALLGSFLLPSLLQKRLMTLPIVYVAFGFAVFSLPIDLPYLNPEEARLDRVWLEHLTEFIVIVSLGGIGLMLDRPPSWRNWRVGILLVAVSMPLTIAAVALIGVWGLGLGTASAVLLGAVLSPTDPVLAEAVQVGPPNDGETEDNVRFSLSLEAGLNDGLAFPFVYLAIRLLEKGVSLATVTHWAAMDAALRIVIGCGLGWVFGRLASWLFFTAARVIRRDDDTPIHSGIYGIAAILVTYGATELLHGYGFLAVFVCAVVARRQRESHDAHKDTFASLQQVELALLSLFLIGFGGVLATGGLDDLTWPAVGLSALLLLVIRPAAGVLATVGSAMCWRRRLAIGVFGIRGLGSLYYLAYAHNTHTFPGMDLIWSTVSVTILASILMHGMGADPILRWASQERTTS